MIEDVNTYSVVPLDDSCGMIEWIDHTSGIRIELEKLYNKKANSKTYFKVR